MLPRSRWRPGLPAVTRERASSCCPSGANPRVISKLSPPQNRVVNRSANQGQSAWDEQGLRQPQAGRSCGNRQRGAVDRRPVESRVTPKRRDITDKTGRGGMRGAISCIRGGQPSAPAGQAPSAEGHSHAGAASARSRSQVSRGVRVELQGAPTRRSQGMRPADRAWFRRPAAAIHPGSPPSPPRAPSAANSRWLPRE